MNRNKNHINEWSRCAKCGLPVNMLTNKNFPYCSEDCERNKDD